MIRPGSAPSIALTGITKRFGAVTALDAVDFSLEPGQVHALLGENGAGKSTLMGVLFGLVHAEAGSCVLDGHPVVIRSPADAIRAGIGMVQQHFSHVPALTVAENVALGGHGRFNPHSAVALVLHTAESAGLPLDPAVRVSDLSVGAQQRLEIVRALAHDARVLALDEPTAVLSPAEASDLLHWLRRFADDGGSVVLVTHKVREALAIADRITVLRGGQRVAHGRAVDFTPASLARAMFHETAPLRSFSSPPIALDGQSSDTAPPIVVARHLELRAPGNGSGIVDATFECHAGEFIGVAAVEGSGYELLLQALAGLIPPATGVLSLPSRISFIPSDRHRDALILDFPLYENLALRAAGSRRGVISWSAIRRRTRDLITDFNIRTASEAAMARELSGGNQQRFVLARELDVHPALLVADNPTRGLDLMATNAIQEKLWQVSREGAVVIAYFSDLDEVLGVADRMLVVHGGRVFQLPANRKAVTQAMVGAR